MPYLDVLDAFLDLVGSKVVVGHQLFALFDGLLQVGGSPAHLVFEGLVLTQQAHCSRQILPTILGGQDLLLLPDPSFLQTADTFRASEQNSGSFSFEKIVFNQKRLESKEGRTKNELSIIISKVLIITSSAISQKNFQRRRDSSRRARRSAASWLSSW